jgi:hypothetical protein
LCGVIPDGEEKADVLVDKGRNIVADVEDEPDRDETGNAVKVALQKVSNDIAIQQSHGFSD